MRGVFSTALLVLAGCGRLGYSDVPDAPGIDAVELPEPALWFPLDEGSGLIVRDRAPGKHDATLTGQYQWTATALHFTQGDAATAMLGGEFRTLPLTLSVWLTADVRTDQLSTQYAILPYPPNAISNDRVTEGGLGAGINVWTDGTPGSDLHIGAVDGQIPGFAAGTRYHVVVVYDYFATTVYVDGQQHSVHPIANFANGQPAVLHVGEHNDDVMYGTKRFFIGEIDDVRIYRDSLSDVQVRVLFTAGPS